MNKEGKVSVKKKKNLIYILIPVVIVLLLVALFFLKQQGLKCGDGTHYGECSSIRPNFCDNGKLIEDASLCGCSINMTKDGNNCISQYQQEPKNISLKYVLRGEEKEINFTVYKKLSNYLSDLPFSIFYKKGEEPPSRADFILRDLNNQEQKNLLLPLVTKIQNEAKDKNEQMRIAVSLVQKIPYGSSGREIFFAGQVMNYSRYPYQVLYDLKGVCGEKTELLQFILRELGFKVGAFYYAFENHEALAIKCPNRYGVDNTGYCFIETTGGAIISDDKIDYSGIGKLYSNPELIAISNGNALGNNMYEYGDARRLISLRDASENNGGLNVIQNAELNELKKKYGLEDTYNAA